MKIPMHTQGPWVVVGKKVYSSDGGTVCVVQREATLRVKISEEKLSANGALIAAAPEMFDALEIALRRLGEKDDGSNRDLGFIRKLEMILEKARGEL